MIVSAVFEYAQNLGTPLLIEYFYHGEKIEDPTVFFEENEALFITAFPSYEETVTMINKYVIFNATHKLVISEYGFNLVFL